MLGLVMAAAVVAAADPWKDNATKGGCGCTSDKDKMDSGKGFKVKEVAECGKKCVASKECTSFGWDGKASMCYRF